MRVNSYRDVDLSAIPQFLRGYLRVMLEREGEWSDDKDDYPTKWGIRQATADFAGYTGELRQLSRNDAARIWAYEWYYKPRLDLVAELSHAICNQVMDTGGPAGISIGIQHLQRALNHYNGPKRDDGSLPYGALLADDGAMGGKTQSALAMFFHHRLTDGERVLFCNINSQQEVHFMQVTKRNPSKSRFAYGWSLGRVFSDLQRLFDGHTPIDSPPAE